MYQNTINNKIYIGKTNNINKRTMHHKLVAKYGKEKYKNSYSYFQKAISKYGIELFNFHILEQFNNEQEALDTEMFYIEYFRSWDREFGYNISLGGSGVSGYHHTNDTKNHLSKVMSGRKRKEDSIELTASKARGELSSNSKLTEAQVLEIINKYATGNFTYKDLSKEYGMSPQQLNRIVLGKQWKHLTKSA
jgi:group I intron endonuclease